MPTEGPDPKKDNLVIAGASGFVGRALIPVLAERFNIIGLSRERIRQIEMRALQKLKSIGEADTLAEFAKV